MFRITTLITTLSISALFFLSTSVLAEKHKMQTFKGAQDQDITSLNVEGVNAFLSDTVSSNDPDAPISCGFFRMKKGNPLEYTYSYDEAKIIVDGEMSISEKDGETFNAVAGDVVYFDKGAKITFASESYGIAFYCGQRALGEL